MKIQLLFLLLMLPMLASAGDSVVLIEGLWYRLSENDHTASVNRNPDPMVKYKGAFIIPETVSYNGVEYPVTAIGECAFYTCHDVTAVTIPSSVKSIGNYACSCTAITSMTIPNSVTSIGIFAFYGCSSLKTINIPDGITTLGKNTFGDCTALTSLTLPNSVTAIGNDTFKGCTSLTTINLSNSLTSIGNNAFNECSSLTYLNLPNSVTTIGEFAFAGCIGLNSIHLPDGLTIINFCTFVGCTGLTSITIPHSVTTIDNSAFDGCTSLSSLDLPNSIVTIGDFAFYECSGLTTLNIPNSVTTIGISAFEYCTGLTTVTIPNSVTTIAEQTFSKCSNLVSITIGSGVETIGQEAFAECFKLADVYCLAEKVPTTAYSAFSSNTISNRCTLHVPATSLALYQQEIPWKSFMSIVALPSQAEKCATPTISYADGKLSFSCETEGVEYVYEITDADIQTGNACEVQLTQTYHVSVYAKKSGYEDSDVATADIKLGSSGKRGDVNGDDAVNVSDVTTVINIILGKE